MYEVIRMKPLSSHHTLGAACDEIKAHLSPTTTDDDMIIRRDDGMCISYVDAHRMILLQRMGIETNNIFWFKPWFGETYKAGAID